MSVPSTPDRDPQSDNKVQLVPFLRSRTGMTLVVLIVVAGLMLAYEHRVHIAGSDWVIWLPILICVGMHFFMHGGHGGHGSNRNSDEDKS